MAGKVTLVSPALDPNSTTVEVWVTAPNTGGAFARDNGHSRNVGPYRERCDCRPRSALLKTPDGATTVMVVGGDDKAHQVSVEAGISEGDRVQITKGLSGGEKVVTHGAYGLPNDTKVKIAGALEADKPGAAKRPAEKDKK